MKFALFLVLSLSAMAFAGPAFNKDNQIQQQQQQQNTYKQQQQQQQYMTETGATAKSPAIDALKQWCFSSQMSQQELTASFKKLVQVIKSNPTDQVTEGAVMGERICQGALVAKSQQTGETIGQSAADAKAHELIKDVYMDAMISCKSKECTQQLLKIVQSQQVDPIRASYYMTRIAVTDKQSIKDEQEVKQLAESYLNQQQQQHSNGESESVERQKLFATTSLIGKWIVSSQQKQQKPSEQIVEIAQQVAKSIVERYVKPVSQQEVEQYKQAEKGEVSQELAKKIAKRSAALKALANIPGHIIKSCQEVEQELSQIAQNKQELSTVRQSAIECLEQNDKQIDLLKQLTFAEEEPIEVRIAAYRALMTSMYAGEQQQDENKKTEEQKKEQAREIVGQLIKHCEQKQQQDDQFVLYCVSHLDNVRTSQQPEVEAIKQTLTENKQHFMQIQLLAKKLKSQLNDVRRSSRNYKLEQEFNQIESGLVLEGDIIYESKQKQQQQQQMSDISILPKLVRVNMSMPVMGETVNVVEITVRQSQMDDELLSALKLVQSTKFNQQTVSKVVDSFKQSAEKHTAGKQQQQQHSGQAQADLTIKVDGCTVVYVSLDDFKYSTSKNSQQQQQQHQRNTRSIYSSNSIVDEIIEHLKRKPISFNRGFNFNIQERIAKVLDIDANVLAGLRFESRAQGQSKRDFEIVAQMEPRFSFEAITGPAKLSSKKLLQRFSTKSAVGLRLRFKESELVDVEIDLPMNTMELFTYESQLVEKSQRTRSAASEIDIDSYSYLPESIYGQEDIYSSYPIYSSPEFTSKLVAKRSIVPSFSKSQQKKSTISQMFKSSGHFSHSYETSSRVARATGLVGKLRLVASPKDMSVLVSAVVEKHEPQMKGYRVKIEQTGGRTSQDVKSYTVTVSTPGSQIDRTMQVRLTKQSGQQRTLIKSEIQSQQMSASFTTELVHDGRQYSVKSEIVSRSRSQWRHAVEFGVVSGPSASSSGRLAHFNYKPYAQIDSTYLKRPIGMQGQIAYVQSPKSVISYELKCTNSGNFVQGKLIFDQRDKKMSSQFVGGNKRAGQMSFRRSMQSPLELIASKDLTFTHEFVAQIEQHAVKVHQMIDWDCQKYSLEGDSLVSYKNLRKPSSVAELVASMKINEQQQVFQVERKCSTDARKQWIVRVVSQVRPTGHQMEAECRYTSRRQPQQQQVVVYKHKLDATKLSANKYDCSLELELVDSARSINEKAQGRVRVSNERKQKQCQLEVNSSRGAKSAKLTIDYESLAKHQIVIAVQSERFAHKCEVRNNERQFTVQSRTERPQTKEQLVKFMIDVDKQTAAGPLADCKLVLEIPARRVSMAADVKLASGKRSSIAVQTSRFASQAELTFDLKPIAGLYSQSQSVFERLYPFQRAANLRFRSNLKDLANKQAYWVESQLNGADLNESSFVRLESPFYRSEFEFSPREQEAKLAAFARTKPDERSFDSIYRFNNNNNNYNNQQEQQQKSSLFEQLNSIASDKLQSLGPSKMWMLRSLIKSPFVRDQIKSEARRALFEYADRRQQHKHSFAYSPSDERINMQFVREPNTEFQSTDSFEPLRLSADLSTEISRPSTVSFESDWMSADVEAKPFGHLSSEQQGESYAKVSALSRHPRSTFKKHDSEVRYGQKSGLRAQMKHVDSKDKRHELSVESDAQPQKWAKMSYDSDKHGKTQWEHKWRQHAEKRAADQQDVYANKMWLKRYGSEKEQKDGSNGPWQHETKFEWSEPIRMVSGERRYRRSIFTPTAFYPIDYLKNTNARFVSTYTDELTRLQQNDKEQQQSAYKMDFDYQPISNFASVHFEMPREMSHLSSLEIKPSERLYKLQSKLYNRRTNEPTYELLASSKPTGVESLVDKLATSEQEPVFVHSSHPMLERPISTESLVYKLFKQPMKLDYSDKFGRVANFDYDQLVDATVQQQHQQQQQKFGGLRQKRAALYYRDPLAELEHSTSYDFYPESFMTKMKPSFYQQQQQYNKINSAERQFAPVAIKTLTKYGPVVVRADSTDETLFVQLESPVMSAKLVGETGANLRKLYKIELDNKSQRVQLQKLLRDAPEFVRDSKIAKKFARKFDSNKFEHQGELLVSIVEQIFKIKSSTKLNERPIVLIEGEWNQQNGKAYAKINGERVNGQCVVDLVRKSAELTLEAGDDKRTLQHVTRLVKTSDKFYSLESMTSHKSRPVFKLTGRVSAKVFDVEHLIESFSSYASQQRASYEPSEHLSTFEAVVYEPKEYHVQGQFDCDKKVARIVIKNLDEQKVQETELRYDAQSETIYVVSQLSSKYAGQEYTTKAKINLPGLYQSERCMTGRHAMRSNMGMNMKMNMSDNNKYVSKYANKYYNNDNQKYQPMAREENEQQTCKSEIVYSDNNKSNVWAAQYYPGQYVSVSSPRGETTFNLAY